MKKVKITAVLMVCILAAAAGVTCAYLISGDNAENTFDVAKVDTRIIEKFDPPDDPVPGDVISKAPKVHSDSDTDCYVRIRVEFTNDAQAICEPLSINSGWKLSDDGYYYWENVLAPGRDTGTLFDEVRIKDSIDQADIKPFDILVYTEAVQAAGISADNAWNTMDRPV